MIRTIVSSGILLFYNNKIYSRIVFYSKVMWYEL